MKRIGADYDIHLVWNIKELINKVGPEKAIREMKKRCEAGAIIGCTIYKRLIEHWLQVAMKFEDRAGRGPAEQFMEAAGEDEWVQKVERLHEEFPNGIPRSKQLDLIDEFNTDLERKVGREIPLEPGDASEEDIKESKRIAGQMARHEKVTPPKPAPPEKETLPPPPKEKEKPRPEPVRAAPEEPIIPVPEPGRKPPELDLMKQEIEERIARMRAEKARGELKAGEGKEFEWEEGMDEIIKLVKRLNAKGYKFIIAGITSYVRAIYPEKLTGIWKNEFEELIGLLDRIRRERRIMLVRAILNYVKSVLPIDEVWIKEDLPKEERIKLAKQMAAAKVPELPEAEVRTEFMTCKDYQEYELKCSGCEFKTTVVRCVYSPAMREVREDHVREDADILTEPKDYSKWTFADFEGLLPGLESVEDLEELYEQVGASEVIPDSDKETLRNLIRTRIDEVKRFYTDWDWATREGK